MGEGAVSPEWISAAQAGASFTYTQGRSTSFWVKRPDGTWTGSRAPGSPAMKTLASENLAKLVGASAEATFEIVNDPRPEDDSDLLIEDVEEAEPEEEPAPVAPPKATEEVAEPPVTAERLLGLRALIVSRNESGDKAGASALVERFRREYARFSEGRPQAEVDRELIAS